MTPVDPLALTGEVAVVTGGARGIGAAVCETLYGHGAHVVCLDRAAADLGELESQAHGWTVADGSGLTTYSLDITDESAVATCLEWVENTFGRLDVLVNNAGIPARPSAMWETPTAHWDDIFAVHVRGTFFVLRAAVPIMLRRSYGRIVNMSSMAGKEGNPQAAAYSSAKAALIGLTKVLGKELATSGVLVNAVTPGFIETPLVATFTAERRAELLSRVPMARAGQASEVADLVAFLASHRVSFSTGAVYDISGGRATY